MCVQMTIRLWQKAHVRPPMHALFDSIRLVPTLHTEASHGPSVGRSWTP
jgi:hypothetical protein